MTPPATVLRPRQHHPIMMALQQVEPFDSPDDSVALDIVIESGPPGSRLRYVLTLEGDLDIPLTHWYCFSRSMYYENGPEYPNPLYEDEPDERWELVKPGNLDNSRILNAPVTDWSWA